MTRMRPFFSRSTPSSVMPTLIAASAAFIVLGYGLIPILGSASAAAAKAIF